MDKDFPVHRVNNVDNLVRHVREEFFCADPITYKEVLRSIRVSKSKSAKSYVTGMYTNESRVKLCQICMQPAKNIETTEIANYGMELSQMNLCLCTNCARNYKNIRDVNKDGFKRKMKEALKGIDSKEDADTYDVILNDDMTLHFTQAHLMEIQILFQLIDEYGLPKADDSEIFNEEPEQTRTAAYGTGSRRSLFDDNNEVAVTEENDVTAKNDSIDGVIEKGSYVTYRKPDGSICENEIRPDKFPFHKEFISKRVGDEVGFMGKNYIVMEVL